MLSNFIIHQWMHKWWS